MPRWIVSTALERLQNPGGDAESLLLARIVPVFTSRRKSVADRQLSSAIKQAQAAMAAGDRKQAGLALTTAQPFTEYASINLQNEWQDLLKNEKQKFGEQDVWVSSNELKFSLAQSFYLFTRGLGCGRI